MGFEDFVFCMLYVSTVLYYISIRFGLHRHFLIQFLNIDIALQQEDKITFLARNMDAQEKRFTVAEEEISAVGCQLAAVERGLLEPGADIAYLRDKEKQLRDKEKQLRDNEKLILELILRQSSGK